MLTSAMLVDFCKKVYAAGWVYWYGTYGKPCSQKLYESKKKQYPAHYTASRASGYQKDIAAGKWCADCVGMIKAFFWSGGQFETMPVYKSNNCPDVSANGMIRQCKETGKIGTIPDEPGLVVWKDGHIGVYIGGGYTIEMRGFNYDCVKRKVKDGPWTKWGRLSASMIRYGDTPAPEPVPEGLHRGDYGTAVTAMQEALLRWDAGCLPKYGADGDFGAETEKAVQAFQQATGLPVTGVYDEATRAALTAWHGHGGCNGDYCDIEPGTDPVEPVPPAVVEITGSTVNVRAAPGKDGKDIGDVHKGDRLPYGGLTAEVDGRDWYLVEYLRHGDNVASNAWVSSKYARLVD